MRPEENHRAGHLRMNLPLVRVRGGRHLVGLQLATLCGLASLLIWAETDTMRAISETDTMRAIRETDTRRAICETDTIRAIRSLW